MDDLSMYEQQMWCEDYELKSLLTDSEKVINIAHIEAVKDKLDELIFKAKHFGEHSKALPLLLELEDDIKFVIMGART